MPAGIGYGGRRGATPVAAAAVPKKKVVRPARPPRIARDPIAKGLAAGRRVNPGAGMLR